MPKQTPPRDPRPAAGKHDESERSIRLVPTFDDGELWWEAQAVIGPDQVVAPSGSGVETHDLALWFLAENLSDKDRRNRELRAGGRIQIHARSSAQPLELADEEQEQLRKALEETRELARATERTAEWDHDHHRRPRRPPRHRRLPRVSRLRPAAERLRGAPLGRAPARGPLREHGRGEADHRTGQAGTHIA